MTDNSTPFRNPFARYYDLLYSDKDYGKECDLLQAVFSKCGVSPSRILDAGCGSGGHAVELAARGYDVTGIDQSADMLAIAREKALRRDVTIAYHTADLRSFSLDRPADACISMFAALSFQLTNGDLQSALTRIRAALVPRGLLVCDVWNGTAVLAKGPEPRLKRVARDGAVAWRFATPLLNVHDQTVEITHHLMVTDASGQHDTIVEAQTVRYFVPQEFAFHLESAGFDVLELFAFPRLGDTPTSGDWTLGAVARARPELTRA